MRGGERRRGFPTKFSWACSQLEKEFDFASRNRKCFLFLNILKFRCPSKFSREFIFLIDARSPGKIYKIYGMNFHELPRVITFQCFRIKFLALLQNFREFSVKYFKNSQRYPHNYLIIPKIDEIFQQLIRCYRAVSYFLKILKFFHVFPPFF